MQLRDIRAGTAERAVAGIAVRMVAGRTTWRRMRGRAALAVAASAVGTLVAGCGPSQPTACGGTTTVCPSPPQAVAQPLPTTTTTTTTVAPPPPPPTTTTTRPRPTTTHKTTTRPVSTGTPCSAAAAACVDLSQHEAWLLQNGHVVYGPVSAEPGRASAPTVPGTFSVLWKDKDHKSSEFHDAPMPWSVFFSSNGSAFHSGSLSIPSHGCVHLSSSAAQRFFAFLDVGDVVQIVR